MLMIPVAVTAKTIQTSQPVVVLDPGHGGSDMGATAAQLIEKDICLLLSGKIAEKLEDRYNVKLTRTEDRMLSADQRIVKANVLKAKLFISIHLGRSGSQYGCFYYYALPGQNPSSNLQERWETMPLIHYNDSKRLARTFVTSFSSENPTLSYQARPAPLRSLQGASMPCVLIEPLPVSSLPVTLEKRDKALDIVAEKIKNGIDAFFRETGK